LGNIFRVVFSRLEGLGLRIAPNARNFSGVYCRFLLAWW